LAVGLAGCKLEAEVQVEYKSVVVAGRLDSDFVETAQIVRRRQLAERQ
jgi:hypothetical protein